MIDSPKQCILAVLPKGTLSILLLLYNFIGLVIAIIVIAIIYE